jgi:hypothetical protein
MNNNIKVNITCKWCGSPLSTTHTGPCPKCGKEGKRGTINAKETIGVKDSLKWESRREFNERNPKINLLIIVITFGSPLLGFFLYGLVGVIIGFFFGVLSYWLSPLAITKVREVKRGSS